MFKALFFLLLSSFAHSIDPPEDERHPGSLVYNLDFKKKVIQCEGVREFSVFVPSQVNDQTATIVFGHGQALGLRHYEESFIHFAKKGVALVFPDYSRGFFDQNWERMGQDFNKQVACALEIENLNKDFVVFSGHSKGAYVASVATGLSFRDDLLVQPKSAVLLNSAGLDPLTLSHIPKSVEMTVIFSDQDRIVERSISDQLYELSPSSKKQLILLRSYPEDNDLNAIHMWPLSKSFLFFGGGPTGAFHYYSLWKWLLGAAEDVITGANGLNEYMYGHFANDKGPIDLKDEIVRSW